MFIETPELLIYITLGAIVLGWLIGKFGAFVAGKFRKPERDPRDTRIRSLEAEHRVSQTQLDKTQANLDLQAEALLETQTLMKERDQIISEQHAAVRKLQHDLKDSVMKTRELRRELSQRAAEDLKSQVRLRDVETELSVAQASTDLIATGVLDYALAPGSTEEPEAEFEAPKRRAEDGK